MSVIPIGIFKRKRDVEQLRMELKGYINLSFAAYCQMEKDGLSDVYERVQDTENPSFETYNKALYLLGSLMVVATDTGLIWEALDLLESKIDAKIAEQRNA